MELPHLSIVAVHLLLIFSSSGITLAAFNPGNCVSYGGFSAIRQKKATLGVWLVAHDIQRSLAGVQPLNHVQTGLVDGAFRLLGVFERDADLVAELGPLILRS